MGRGEIEILFQPQYAALDRRLVGAEALAHWRHPEKGRIGGDRLFAIAAQGGLVEALSGHVMRTALDAAGNWSVPVRLSLNVTAADVAGGDFAEIVMFAVRDAGFPAEHLTLEITEQVLLAELDRTAEKLRRLSVLGIRIALDDFGAGFCNFDYLKRLPLHYLKLDRGMIAGIDQDPRDLVVLRGIVAMARGLGLEVIAEGVEREAQLQAIVREGCSGWQGFLGAEPMSAADFATLSAAH